LDLPPIAHDWAHSQGLVLLSDLPAHSASTHPESRPQLEIISPGNHTLYIISPNLDRESQRIHFEAVSTVALSEIRFWLDGVQIAALTQPPYETWWILEVGEHTLWAEGTLPNGDSWQSPAIHFTVSEDE
jgi:hypothetical protein